jgi:hypothetical protein
VIPDLTPIAKGFGLLFAFMPVVLAALLTGVVFFVQAVASWFENRNF